MCKQSNIKVDGVEFQSSLSPEQIKKLPLSDRKQIAAFLYACAQTVKSKTKKPIDH